MLSCVRPVPPSDEELLEKSAAKYGHFPIISNACFFYSNKDSDPMLWHYRLGHPNFLYLKKCFHFCLLIKIRIFLFVMYVKCQNTLGTHLHHKLTNHLNHFLSYTATFGVLLMSPILRDPVGSCYLWMIILVFLGFI